MDDVLILICNNLLTTTPTPSALLAFVKLQATHRGIWLLYRNNRALWEKLERTLPKWSLPPHMGLRRRVIAGIKLLFSNCHACAGPAPRVFMAFQSRFCRRCCHRLMISDHELAWRHGVTDEPRAAFVVKYYGGKVRVKFYLRKHLAKELPYHRPTPEQRFAYHRMWSGLGAQHVRQLLNQMT